MMKKAHHLQLDVLAGKLLKDFFVIAPTKIDGLIKNAEIHSPREIDWSGELAVNSWKEYFLPHREKIFDINGTKLTETVSQQPPMACFGVHIKDLQALTLFDLAFKNDKYYQKRRDAILVIGYSIDWLATANKKGPKYPVDFKESDLEHVRFDIFISKTKSGKTLFYAGSKKGEKLLTKFGLHDYIHMPFVGAVPEEGPDKRMLFMAEKMAMSSEHSLWDEMDKICLACGKCSNVCPTCFCFDFIDKVEPHDARRERVRGSCFHSDFSLVAGGNRDLSTVKKKIYFWYAHKFIRIPKEYRVPGCVSCGRCVSVCPVGINIFKNLGKIAKIKKPRK